MSAPDHGHDCDTPGCKSHWTCDEECGEPSPTTCRDCLQEQLTRAVAVEEAARKTADAPSYVTDSPEMIAARDELWVALADLPPNPLEPVRALLHEAGRSLDLKKGL